MAFWKKLVLWQKILLGMGLGTILGLIISPEMGIVPPPAEGGVLWAEHMKPAGMVFIQMIKMLVVPLVFFSLISGVTSMRDPKVMGRVGGKAFGIYMITTMFSISIGLGVGYLFNPGEGVKIAYDATKVGAEHPGFVAMMLNIIPTNPVDSLAEGNILQIIFFAILSGISLVMVGDKATPIIDTVNTLNEMMFKMTHIVMAYAPIGVFALMAWVTGTQGVDVLVSLFWLVVTFLTGAILHVSLVYGGGVKFLMKLSPLRFLKNIGNALAVAFSTSSSSATLPVTMEVAEENVGVSNGTASFVLPLGATINMDGTALYQGVCVMFVAQAVGVDLAFADWVTVVLTSTLASIGVAGIPGAGIVMLGMVLGSVGLPVDAVAIILGVDRLLDMVRTAVNVAGDSFVCAYVDQTEGHLDEEIFYKKNEA